MEIPETGLFDTVTAGWLTQLHCHKDNLLDNKRDLSHYIKRYPEKGLVT